MMLGRAPRLGTTWNGFLLDEEYVGANTRSLDSMIEGLAAKAGPYPSKSKKAQAKGRAA